MNESFEDREAEDICRAIAFILFAALMLIFAFQFQKNHFQSREASETESSPAITHGSKAKMTAPD